MAYLAILGGERTLAMVHNANVGVSGAALRNGVQGPISNLFHAHSKIPSFLILNDLECGQLSCSVGFWLFLSILRVLCG
jgi:hypothetical protein